MGSVSGEIFHAKSLLCSATDARENFAICHSRFAVGSERADYTAIKSVRISRMYRMGSE